MPPQSDRFTYESIDESKTQRQLKASNLTWLAGCGFILYTLSVTALMLLVNSVICVSLHTAFRNVAPELFTDHAQIATPASQMFFFLAPIVLLIIEWNWLDRFSRSRR